MKHISAILAIFFTLTIHAQRQMITTVTQGGTYGQGSIFMADSNGNNFHEIYAFESVTGRYPVGHLVIKNDGMVFGVTVFGGLSDSCTIYSYNLLTGDYTLLHDFYATPQLGWWDNEGPVLADDGKLYGVNTSGGQHNLGSIYRFEPASQIYSAVHYFDTINGAYSNCLLPLPDGKLCGITSGHGLYGAGVIFSVDPLTDSFTVLYNMVDTTGQGATGQLLLDTSGIIYGGASTGGRAVFGYGTLFSFNLSTGTYTLLHKFDGFNGCDPVNPLVKAPNNKLYGVTRQCGSGNSGVLFSYDLQTNTYAVEVTFNSVNGTRPEAGLRLAPNGKLYGTTSAGGSHNGGVIFSYDINTSSYTKVFEFDSLTGFAPYGTVQEVTLPSTVGIQPSTELHLQVIPNPATSFAYINSPETVKSIELTDLSGRKYQNYFEQIGEHVYRISGLGELPAGIYFVKIECDSARIVRKLIIQK